MASDFTDSPRILVAFDMLTEMGQMMYRGVVRGAVLKRNWRVHKIELRPTEAVMRRLQETSYDGVIAHVASSSLMEALQNCGLPVVNTSNTPMEMGFPSVFSDDVKAGVMAGEYLLWKGYRRVGYLSLPTRYSRQRLAGLQQVAGLQVESFPGESGLEEVLQVLRGISEPMAWVACDDAMGVNFCREAEAKGIQLATTGAVMGFNDEPLRCEVCHPPLTSVALPFERIGEKAVERLASLIGGEMTTPDSWLVEPLGVTERLSTTPSAIGSKAVREAVAFIEKRRGDVDMAEVMQGQTCTRRSLEQGFKSCLNITPHQYILRVRADRARRLLAESDLSITEIALQCGFSGSTQIGWVFRKFYEVSPREVRRRMRR